MVTDTQSSYIKVSSIVLTMHIDKDACNSGTANIDPAKDVEA